MHSINLDEIISFIQKTVHDQGISNLVVAVSGGIDSATTLHLVCTALSPQQIFPIMLPYGKQNLQDAEALIATLGIPTENYEKYDIQPAVEQIESNLPFTSQKLDTVRSGNVMARIRMIYIYDFAKRKQALVCGTENKSEKYLGYFTRFGDEASDIEPIQHLYKTQVQQLARELGVPQAILDKQPSAGLWEGQTDEKELGFSYHDADKVLEQLIDHAIPADEIKLDEINPEVVKAVVKRVETQHFKLMVPYRL